MTAANYTRCLANTLREEGGWSNHPSDPGGPTMRGVIQREYDRYRTRHGLARQSVRYISEQELQDIYRGNYWAPMRGDLWPKGPDQIVFDIAVNSGTGRAPQIMAAAMGTAERSPAALAALANRSADNAGIVKRACARRASFYRALRTFSVFGRGWLARNARMEAIGVKMALEAHGSANKTDQLRREAAGASKHARRAGQGAAAASTGSGGAGGALTQADHAAWDWTAWLALGLGIIAVVALVVALWWAWRRHGERAKAYLAAARGELETDFGAVMMRIRESGENTRHASELATK